MLSTPSLGITEVIDGTLYVVWRFQLPLSGSHLAAVMVEEALDQLSTPSLGITEEGSREGEDREHVPFNSLSRDHDLED